jgi:hypothetical protein
VRIDGNCLAFQASQRRGHGRFFGIPKNVWRRGAAAESVLNKEGEKGQALSVIHYQ